MKRDDVYEEFQCVAPALGQPASPDAPEAVPEAAEELYLFCREWLELLWYDITRYRWILLVLGFLLIGAFLPPTRGVQAYVTSAPWILIGAIVIAYVVLTGILEPGGSMFPDWPSRRQETPPERVALDDVPVARIEVERDRKRLTWVVVVGLLFLLFADPKGNVFGCFVLGPVVVVFAVQWALNRLL